MAQIWSFFSLPLYYFQYHYSTPRFRDPVSNCREIFKIPFQAQLQWTGGTKSAVCSKAENFHFIPFHPKSISGLCLQTPALDTQGVLTVTQKGTKVPLGCWNTESVCCYSQQIKTGKATNCLTLVVFVSSVPPQLISAPWCTHVSIVGQTVS